MLYFKRILILSILFFSLFSTAQEEVQRKKLVPIIEITAQTPLRMPNGFYNKNTLVSQFFRSGYGAGIQYRFNEKWAINGVANFNHRFIEQRFYFSDTLLLGLVQNHVIQEVGFKIGGLRTMSNTKNSNFSFNFNVEPWLNLPKKDNGPSFSGEVNGKRTTRVIIDAPQRLQMSYSVGVSYEYFRSKMSLGFRTDLILRFANRTSYMFVAEDYFSYKNSYSTSGAMLGITGFVTF